MPRTEQELESCILGNPLDDSLRIELEQLLNDAQPESIDAELLRRERLIAEALENGESIDHQMHEYKTFRSTHSDYFWDMRGCREHTFRPFSLWVVWRDPARALALDIAIQNKLRRTINTDSLPIELIRGKHLDHVLDLRTGIIDFVNRYRGPTGHEPTLRNDELNLVVLPTYSRQLAAPVIG